MQVYGTSSRYIPANRNTTPKRRKGQVEASARKTYVTMKDIRAQIEHESRHSYGLVAFDVFLDVKAVQLIAEARLYDHLQPFPKDMLSKEDLQNVIREADDIWRKRSGLNEDEKEFRKGRPSEPNEARRMAREMRLVEFWGRLFACHRNAASFLDKEVVQAIDGHNDATPPSERASTTKEPLTTVPDRVSKWTYDMYMDKLLRYYHYANTALRSHNIHSDENRNALEEIWHTTFQFYSLMPTDLSPPYENDHPLIKYIEARCYALIEHVAHIKLEVHLQTDWEGSSSSSVTSADADDKGYHSANLGHSNLRHRLQTDLRRGGNW